MTELESGFRIADVTALLRRRFPILLVAALVGLVAGYFTFASAPPSYSATPETYDSSSYDVVGRYFFMSLTKKF